MYSSSYQVPAVNINQSISPKAHFLGCFGMGTFIQSTSLKARFLEAAPSSGFKSYDLILHCLVFKEHPCLLFCCNTVLLPPHLRSTYCLCMSRSGSSLRLVLQQNPCAITRIIHRVVTDFQASRFVSQLLYNISRKSFCQEVFKIFSVAS